MGNKTAAVLLALAALSAGAAPRHWSITIVGSAADPRVVAVGEAVEFWNEQFARLNANMRLGPIERSDVRIPDEQLRAVSEAALERGRPVVWPSALKDIRGDVVVVLSGTDLISVGFPPAHGRAGVVILRAAGIPPLSLPNVARNVVAHELGHVLGLAHNADPAMLMCGRPAPCRPALFRSETKLFFPLTESEQRELAKRFR